MGSIATVGRPERRLVVVLGRDPRIDVVHVATRAIAETDGHVALLTIGDPPNAAQSAFVDDLLRFSAMWMDSLFVYDITISAIRADDDVVVAATGRERELLESLFEPRRHATG